MTRGVHRNVLRRRKGVRRKGILWEYNADGRQFAERIKGHAKRYWRRWMRRMNKQECVHNVTSYHNDGHWWQTTHVTCNDCGAVLLDKRENP